jgi:hypothetical protein
MKRLRDWLAKRDSDQVLLALALIGFAPVIVGFFFLDGFAPHVVAGFAGLVLGAVLAVVLIENLLQQRRREHWDIARAEMVRTICEGLVRMAGSFAIEMSGHRYLTFAGPSDSATPEMARALEEELYPEVVDACEEEGGVPSRLLKTDRRKAGKEGTPWRMFAGSLSGRTTRPGSRSMISRVRARVG